MYITVSFTASISEMQICKGYLIISSNFLNNFIHCFFAISALCLLLAGCITVSLSVPFRDSLFLFIIVYLASISDPQDYNSDPDPSRAAANHGTDGN